MGHFGGRAKPKPSSDYDPPYSSVVMRVQFESENEFYSHHFLGGGDSHGDAMDIVSPSSQQPIDLHTIRSRARELENTLSNWEEDSSETEGLLNDCALEFQRKIEEIALEWSDVGFSEEKDLDACLEHLTEELNLVVAENTQRSQEIEILSKAHAEDFSRLGTEFESLKYSLDYTALQDVEEVKVGTSDDYLRHNEDQSSTIDVCHGDKLELLELENQIKKKNLICNSLEELDSIFKWFDATEQVEDAFASVKVIALDQNCIRLSLQTYILIPESVLSQQKIVINIPSEVKHELLIEVVEGTLNQKNVEIYPNDVHIDEIRKAANNFGKSSLKWFVTQVQDRIVLCTMRQFVVKSANKSGYSLEYLDKDEMIVAHLVEGVNAFIKVPQGWPMSNSPLKLTSIKSSNHYTEGISSSFVSKVKDGVNSQAAHVRQNLLSFLDAVEKLVVEQRL